ncbi:MAG: hypothetical protein V3T23_01650 [Nitrososphaerales archaeon]
MNVNGYLVSKKKNNIKEANRAGGRVPYGSDGGYGLYGKSCKLLRDKELQSHVIMADMGYMRESEKKSG